MRIAIPRERAPGETRVAASPDAVKKYVGFGFDVVVEKGAGDGAAMTDAEYQEAGATIAKDEASALKDADVVLKIQKPVKDDKLDELAMMKKDAVLVAQINALVNREDVEAYAKAGIMAFDLQLMPRISRAQSMDILSSQNNLAGYKAVLDGAAEFGSAMPMMMTAGGTVPPAKVFIMGVGVAGLQAIATAKRLGAVVTATDVRPATKEQVESLGGKFVMVDEASMKDAETSGGYRGLQEEAGAGHRRPHQETGHRHHHGLDPRQTGTGAGHRGDGQEHEAGIGDRRSGGRGRRQLPIVRTRQGGRQAWRQDRRSYQRSRPPRQGREFVVRQEYPELPQPPDRQGEQDLQVRLGGRHRQRDLAHP
jgi:hypothetical protein